MNSAEVLEKVRDRIKKDTELVKNTVRLHHFNPSDPKDIDTIERLRRAENLIDSGSKTEDLAKNPGFYAIDYLGENYGFLYLYEPPKKLLDAITQNKFKNIIEISYAIDKTKMNRPRGLVAQALKQLPSAIQTGEINIETILGKIKPGNICVVASVTHENLASQANLLEAQFIRTKNRTYDDEYNDKYPTFVLEIKLPQHPRHVE